MTEPNNIEIRHKTTASREQIKILLTILDRNILKQAGTGPSRRHIQGSKIAKRLPSVKYSFTVLENRNFLKKKILKKLRTKKIGPSGALTSHNAEKLKGGTI